MLKIIQNINSKTNCQSIFITLLFALFVVLPYPHCAVRLAYNVVAASRRRGFHKGSGGRYTSKFAQNCLREYTPACVKPLVISRFIVITQPHLFFCVTLLFCPSTCQTVTIHRKSLFLALFRNLFAIVQLHFRVE